MILTTDLEQVVSSYLKQNYKDFERLTNWKKPCFSKSGKQPHTLAFSTKMTTSPFGLKRKEGE